VPQLAVHQGQAQHSAEQHYRSNQVQLSGRDQSGGYQLADSTGERRPNQLLQPTPAVS